MGKLVLDLEKITIISTNREIMRRGARGQTLRYRNTMEFFHDDFDKDRRTIVALRWWTQPLNGPEPNPRLVADRYEEHTVSVHQLAGYDPVKQNWSEYLHPEQDVIRKGSEILSYARQLQALANAEFSTPHTANRHYRRGNVTPQQGTLTIQLRD